MFDLLDCLILQEKQIDYRTALKLNSIFGSLKKVWDSSQSELETITGKNEAVNLLGSKNVDRKNYAISINSARSKGIQMYCAFDDEYPEVLKELEAPPLVLYVKGEMSNEIN